MVEKQKGDRTITHPQKIDHFQIRHKPDGYKWVADPGSVDAFGDKPTVLPIELLSDDPEAVFRSELAVFIGRRRVFCFGDGETASRLDTASGTRSEIACPFGDCEYFQRGDCMPRGNLVFAIPDLGPGIAEYYTKGWNTIRAIQGSLAQLQAMTGGILAGLPVQLAVTPEYVKQKGHDKLRRVYIVNLRFRPEEIRQKAAELARLRATAWHRPSPVRAPTLSERDSDEIRDLADEFDPESAEDGEAPQTGSEETREPESGPPVGLQLPPTDGLPTEPPAWADDDIPF
jgi:hypothetical protein